MVNKLTLEVLAPYLPYGLRVFSKVTKSTHNLIGLTKHELMISRDKFNGWYSIANFKPILRPISDLTKDIEHNGERFVSKEVLIDRYDLKFDEDDDFFLDYYCIGETDSPWTGYHIIQLLIQWHFDVFGLIEKGLAVDINTLENA